MGGVGLEFGAANDPMPSAPGNKVYYADLYSDDEGKGSKVSKPKDFVKTDFCSSIDDYSDINKMDFDFIVSSHVIEHTPKTIKAIKLAYEHLRPGGIFLAAVPHKALAYDMGRNETSLKHFIKDYESYDIVDDLEHLREYYPTQPDIVFGGKALDEVEKDLLAGEQLDIHYHAFTPNSFRQLIVWFNNNVYKWKTSYVYDPIPYKDNKEFWVLLEK